ncbi:rhodanese [Sphingomonas sp. A2-49]|uniref:rhodanese n=1 Tax=Sphingomonas sp. A2-49 TaxID=1391375 RepID=UPI0021D0610F|nr:rhodanese [Sphingomonas sp. A2-49]MCU6454567.1 rhodanese [Sphingomonas sp. A2-49]
MVLARLLAAAALLAAPVQDAAFDPASGYRIAAYRGIVPGPPPGVPRIAAAAVAALRERAVLVDVAPAEGGVRDPVTGDWRLARPAVSIPGAHWFPEAGRGRPDPAIERWFLAGVRTLAARRPGRPIVVFCLADCWMSWNAALRLHRAGLRPVLWFGEGSDGWRDLGRRLAPVVPYRAAIRPG